MDSVSNIRKAPNRCNAYTNSERKCRAKLFGNNLFCCKNHEPINKDIIEDGCFICHEIVNNTNDIIYFNCKHAFHKPCYYEWLEYSTYETPICLICRNDNILKFLKAKQTKTKTKIKIDFYDKLYSVNNILYNSYNLNKNNNEEYNINYGSYKIY
jgi:hypothetical protein